MFAGITGAHVLIYSDNAEADRAFFHDVLNFPAVDAGGGWLIFALPPAEAGFHPSDGEERRLQPETRLLKTALYPMCDDLGALQNLCRRKASSVPRSKQNGGESKRRSDCPAAAKLACTNPRIRRPSA